MLSRKRKRTPLTTEESIDKAQAIASSWTGGNLRKVRNYADKFPESKWFPFKTKGDVMVYLYFVVHKLSRAAFSGLLKMQKEIYGAACDVTFLDPGAMIKYVERNCPTLMVEEWEVDNLVRISKRGKKSKTKAESKTGKCAHAKAPETTTRKVLSAILSTTSSMYASTIYLLYYPLPYFLGVDQIIQFARAIC
jgi:hypothetical protein